MSEAARRNLDYYERSSGGRDDYWRYMAAPRFRMRTVLEELAKAEALRVVDLGCGNGLLLDEVARRFPATVRTGIDLSPAQVDANRRRHPDTTWLALDLARPEVVPDELQGSFDTVVACEVIEHVDDALAFLRNARSLATEGGCLVLSTQSGPVRETERRVGHVRHYSRHDVSRLLAAAGWRPVRVWNAGFPFHDLSKWWANRRPDDAMERFGTRRYGTAERALCAVLRFAFRFNSRRHGAQLFAVGRREGR
jgi:2-polyprenyl-3-methyl-5-hydroxy-6-metoxy-1,4-benzoquinol methylase